MRRLRPDPKVTQLERNSRALVEDLCLLRRKHYRPHASLSRVRCCGSSVRRPINLDPIITRGQVRNHPVKAVRAQGRLVERKVASGQRVERGARGSNRLEQVRTNLDVPILVRYREIRRHGSRSLITEWRDLHGEIHARLRRTAGVFRVDGHVGQQANHS